MNKIFR